MKVIFAVRRFGPVGGMERYVLETVRELLRRGHEVKVLCEECLVTPPDALEVHELGAVRPRPRWLALARFGRKVSAWLREHPHPGWLVHSHERLACHHVTTYHGQPFATIFEKHWSRWLSWRVVMQLYLEWRELAVAECVVPVSQLSRQQLARYYPQFAHKLTSPVEPGVAELAPRRPRFVPPDGGVVAFVGKEWQRKGLPFAVAVVEHLRARRPGLRFLVQGPDTEEIRHLFARWNGGYELTGWSQQADYAGCDVLLHPAWAEPFGMVIAEAAASGVPVVISDRCGAAAQITPQIGAVLRLDDTVQTWAAAVEQQLERRAPVSMPVRGWGQVVQDYESLYRRLQTAPQGQALPVRMLHG